MGRILGLIVEDFEKILGKIPSCIAVIGEDLSIEWMNETLRSVFSWTDQNSSGSYSFQSFDFIEENGERVQPGNRPIDRTFLSGFPTTNELFGLRAGAMREPVWFRISTQLHRHRDGASQYLLITLNDANLEIESKTALKLERENLRRIVSDTPVGICITDHRGVFEFANPAYLTFYGYQLHEIIGRHFTLVVPERLHGVLAQAHDRFIDGVGESRGEWIVVDRQGKERVILADATRIVDDAGNPKKVTFIIDISDRKQLELALQEKRDQLERLSITDELTGLHNRRHAESILAHEILRADRTGKPLSVALVDIDHFKTVNDRFGHAKGDEVLIGFAGALKAAIRDTDMATRFGGEEFLIILPFTFASEAVDPIRRARELLSAGMIPALPDPLTFSAGIAQYRSGEQPKDLIARADELLYRAKEGGRDRIVHLSPYDDVRPANNR